VTQTSMSANLLQPLQVITKGSWNLVSKELGVLACFEVLLSIEKPGRNLVLCRVLENCNYFLNFLLGKFSSTFFEVNSGFLNTNVTETATDTFDGGESIHHLLVTINVGVENT